MKTLTQSTEIPLSGKRPRVAIVGSGIAGLSAAYALRDTAHVTLFEANDYFGGHTHTVDVTLPTPAGDKTWGIDTGFLVLNERTYPGLLALFAELRIPLAPSDMSFSVKVPNARGDGQTLEWSGTTLSAVFSQKTNLFRLDFWRMLRDILRFNKIATAIARTPPEARGHQENQPLAVFLEAHRFSKPFINWYLLPMLGSIWSCPTAQMLAFPVATLVQFCDNHGLLQVANRPKWFTVAGGARQYVDAILKTVPDARLSSPVSRITRDASGVSITTARGTEPFDHVIVASHPDQALTMLADATPAETSALRAIRYQPNVAVLHTDPSVLPSARQAWSAWNYERAPALAQEDARVCLHYLINQLQPLPFTQPVVVSLNPVSAIAPESILGTYHYDHPIFDLAAINAQRQIAALQGAQRTYFCGAWTGYGFHEDGLQSGLRAASALRAHLDMVASQRANT